MTSQASFPDTSLVSDVRPNVVLIFMDDMTHWALLSPKVATPALDSIRARGTTFTHAFNQGSRDEAVCMPARQMLISGLTLFDAERDFMKVPHLGRVLGDNGFHTFFTGKWHNEVEALESDYDVVGPWAGGMLHSTEIGGDAYRRPSEGSDWEAADVSRGGHWMTLEDGSIQHSSERWTDAAVDFVKAERPDRPFFLHLAYHAPHDPRQAPQEFLDRYPIEEMELPPNFMEAHPFDNGELEVRDELLAPMPRTPEAIRLHRREYFAILSHMDRELGRLLSTLEAEGELGNTLIIFSGDHGLALGEHGLMGKQNLYDHSIRVPLVFAGPGVEPGRETSELVYSGSIYPTVCDLVGITPPAHLGFRSLSPLLADEGLPGEVAIFGAYKDLQRVVRTRLHKLIKYSPSQREQLFAIANDPWELEDLSMLPDYEAVKAELSSQLSNLSRSLGDPSARAFDF